MFYLKNTVSVCQPDSAWTRKGKEVKEKEAVRRKRDGEDREGEERKESMQTNFLPSGHILNIG